MRRVTLGGGAAKPKGINFSSQVIGDDEKNVLRCCWTNRGHNAGSAQEKPEDMEHFFS